MVRELAHYELAAYAAVLTWPIREALIAYRAMMIEAARAAYRHELSMWASIAPHGGKKSEPPPPPPILREVVIRVE
jgi:hypothetical protein